MRQAGRTLPEFRELRQKHSFWEICTTPELAAVATLQPVRRFPLDAAIIFSDILTIPAAMGLEVQFSPGIQISPLVASAADVDRLPVPDAGRSLRYVADALRQTRAAVGPDFPVLGFSGAPFTLAVYMVEGGGRAGFARIKSLMYGQPATLQRLLTKLADAVADYLGMQIEASATAVQIFDTWAGELAPEDFTAFALPAVQRIIERIGGRGVPVIYYINSAGNLLEPMDASGADVLGVDWRVSLAEVRRRLGETRAVQGNLDPGVLFGPPALIAARTASLVEQTKGQGHIVNLGHGVHADTPLEGIAAFIEAVHACAPLEVAP